MYAQFLMMDRNGTVYMVSCLDGRTKQYLYPTKVINPWKAQEHSPAQLCLISEYDLDEAGDDGPKISHNALLVLCSDDHATMTARARCVYPATVRKIGRDVTGMRRLAGIRRRINHARRFLKDVAEGKRRYGHWSCADDSNIIDVVGCSALLKELPWCVD